MSAPDTIVLIHGFWVTPRSWEDWVAYYEAKGFKVIAPAYPGLEVEVEALNADPTPIAELTVPEDRRPPRVGRAAARQPADHHGPFGGRRVHADPARQGLRRLRRRAELRADRGRQGRAALAAALDVPDPQEPGEPPPRGRVHVRAVPLRVHQRRRRGDRAAAVRALRGRRPTAGSCSRASLANVKPGHQDTWVDYHNDDRAPLLFISGSDRPHHAAERPAARTPSTTSPTRPLTEITEFEGPHFMPALEGWEKIADQALEWALANARSTTAVEA